jgi:hypothetical protein
MLVVAEAEMGTASIVNFHDEFSCIAVAAKKVAAGGPAFTCTLEPRLRLCSGGQLRH